MDALSLIAGASATGVGIGVGYLIRYFQGHSKIGKSGKEAAKSGQVTCGACGTLLLGQPDHVVVSASEAFKYYRCPQCATGVTIPLPPA